MLKLLEILNKIIKLLYAIIGGAMIGLIIGASLGIWIMIVYNLTVNSHPFPNILELQMGLYSYYDRKDEIVKNITEFCYPFNNPTEQAECVIYQTCPLYNYTPRHDANIKTPTELITDGGICRDYAVFVDSVMRNLGWDTDFIFSKNHVYNAMVKNMTFCTINSCRYDCYVVSGAQ